MKSIPANELVEINACALQFKGVGGWSSGIHLNKKHWENPQCDGGCGDGKIEYEMKGDDTHLVSDLVGEAYEDNYGCAIIVSGDEDFISPIERVRKLKKKIENAYFSSSSSYNLRMKCDKSIHLNKIISRIIS